METYYTYKTTSNPQPTYVQARCSTFLVPMALPLVSVQNGTYYYIINVETEQLPRGIFQLYFYNNTDELLNTTTLKK